jgi:NADH:ubiquinone oxidoreductase subunit 6 (subunit J)
MTEVIVFLIVGSVAIVSAALMLISRNAVHSAVFLVLNFLCVAFFFLTLSAPFIALVQVAVYAGAIMVLFLFVIMLLGAERIGPDAAQAYHWLPRTAIVLVVVFLVTVGWALASGEINLNTPPPAAPQVRVIHAADAPPVDVYLNNQIFAENVDFRRATDYQSLPAGTYGVTVFPTGADPATESPAILGDLQLVDGDVVSAVALGADGIFQIVQTQDNPTPIRDDEARLTLLNGLPEQAVDLVDPGLPLDDTDSVVLIPNASFGETVETLVVDVDDLRTLQVLPAGDLTAEPVATFRELEVAGGTNNILIPAPEALTDGSARIVPLLVETETAHLFGSPAMVAEVLYTRYLLPFEMVSVLLLAAMVGAIVLTRRELVAEQRARRPAVRRPLVGAQAAAAVAGKTASEEDAEHVLTPGG